MTITKKMEKDYIENNRGRNVYEMSRDELEYYCSVLALYCDDCGTLANYDTSDLFDELLDIIEDARGEDEDERAGLLDAFTMLALEDDLNISESLFLPQFVR